MELVFINTFMFEHKLEILRKKLKFEIQMDYACIMVIVDNMKKAKLKATTEIQNGHGYFSTAFLVEVKKEIVKAVEDY